MTANTLPEDRREWDAEDYAAFASDLLARADAWEGALKAANREFPARPALPKDDVLQQCDGLERALRKVTGPR